MLRHAFAFLLTLSSLAATAQTARQLPAKRTTAAFKIDGELSEAAWKEAQPASNFIEWRPTSGKPENPATGTEVYILYSNTSIYIGGYCHERTRDSVSRELVGRDVVGVNDFVGVIFDTYNDKINAFGFYVTPHGEQFDAKYSSTNGEDGSWSGVWNSAAKIHNDGWSFEMEIPYSALRFVSKPNQTWGINITRRRNKTGQQFMWNPVDPQKNGFINQEGEWTGIEKIEPPLRLSLSPYLGVYATNNSKPEAGKKAWNSSVTGGMDVKWGVSDAFTLDMTLIPDFGQVRSDNLVLNLSPFEQRYQENRPFFTEGTELFNKGNLFYSRRIGLDAPMHMGAAYARAAELKGEVIDNPAQAKLINATKFSGRTTKGLGIGVFNAVQRAMYATVSDSSGKYREKVKTGNLTNYNVLVFDQTMKNNSSVSFINTNVLRDGEDPDANVSAFLFDINNKKNTYNWNGNVSVSQIFAGGKNTTGYAHVLGFGKTGGRFNFNVSEELYDDKYDKTDLGFMNNNNYLDHYMWVGYKWTSPTKHFNSLYLNFNQGYSMRFKPMSYQQYWVNVNANGQLKNLWYAGFYVGYNADGHDYYEARDYQGGANPQYFVAQSKLMTNFWVETNNAKKYKVNINAGVDFNEQFAGHRYDFSVYQRYRFNDKVSVDYNIYYSPWIDNAGFYDYFRPVANGPYTDVLLSRRNRNTIENTFSVKYSFSNRAFINLRARHYWTDVEVKELYDLQSDGTLAPTKHTGMALNNQNINFFNVDATYTLQFAPGSFLNIMWKNQTQDFDYQDYMSRYGKNLTRTLDAPMLNNFSVKVIYYLDYLTFRKWGKK
ncbi:DUF5916 domain-containing protein [Flaviaesturariibacter terrae]